MKTVFAQTFSKVASNSIAGPLIIRIVDVIVIPIMEALFLVAILMFIFGVFKMIMNGTDASVREEGQKTIMWSIVGMFIMISVYGIIRLIANTLGLGDPFL